MKPMRPDSSRVVSQRDGPTMVLHDLQIRDQSYAIKSGLYFCVVYYEIVLQVSFNT